MFLSHTRWPIFGALVVGVAMVALLWYFVLANPKGEAVPASGGHYVEGVTRAPERINPLFSHANPTDADLTALIFSGLVRLGPDGTPLPDLAERWEITGNGQSYVFYLRRGVAWQDSDNTPLTAEDVVFTFQAISDPAFKGDPALAQLMQGVVVTARDPYTVEFRLEQAYAPFLAYMTVGIVPKYVLDGLDANQLYNDEFNADPVGSGPYRFASRTRNSVVLESNPTYYLGPPRVSTLEFRIFPEDDALTAALRQREIDGAMLRPGTRRADLDFIQDTGAYALHGLTSTSVNMVFLDTRSPLFSDPAVRTALLQGMSRETLVEEVALGQGEVSAAGIPTMSWAHTEVEVPEFNAGTSASALERAGWARGRDGVRHKDGVRLAFELVTNNDPHKIAIAENVARQWQSIDVEARVVPLDATSYIDETLLPRAFTAALVEIDPGPDPDPYPFWHSSQITPLGRNLSNYANARMDDVLERARQTTDVQRRRELYEVFSTMLITDLPAVPLHAPAYMYVQSQRTQGFAASLLFTSASRFANVNQWYVNTRIE
ncbi:MAG: peptide ABC transporter substrate-binding protein [Dehalococcoidia bacterium]